MNCTVYSLLKTKRQIKRQTKREREREREREIFQFGPTWGRKNEVRMEKVLQGVTPLL